MAWVKFLTAIFPALRELARALYVALDGDVAQANANLSAMTDEWKNWGDTKARLRARLAAAAKDGAAT